MNSYAYSHAHVLVKKLRDREISALELVDYSIARIESYNSEINAVVVNNFEKARLEAARADKLLAQGEAGALLGLPITMKESYSVAGLPKSWGAPGHEKPELEDGVVAARLRKEGAIILGKTNVPTYLGDWQSHNDVYGVTNNPWDLSCTPGGSSGGSAAAVASGFVSLEIGSDLNGSLRMPASCCGIYAHNPSYNLVPQRGHEPPGYKKISVSNNIDFAVNGPLARCPQDLALALHAIAGPDDDMAMAYNLCLPKSRHTKLEDFRVLMLTHHPFVRSSHDVENALELCAEHLIRKRVKLERSAKNLPDLKNITRVFLQQLLALLSVDLSDANYEKARMRAAQLDNKDQSPEACAQRGEALTYRDYAHLGRLRTQLRHQWREFFKDFDVVLCPAMPMPAFAHDHSKNLNNRVINIDDRQVSYGEQGIWYALSTLTGQPCTTMPIGLSSTGLPIGMQIIGPFLEDLSTIMFAQCLEQDFGGFLIPPRFSTK